jgi:hypothetical protein
VKNSSIVFIDFSKITQPFLAVSHLALKHNQIYIHDDEEKKNLIRILTRVAATSTDKTFQVYNRIYINFLDVLGGILSAYENDMVYNRIEENKVDTYIYHTNYLNT